MHEYLTEERVLTAIASEEGSSFVLKHMKTLEKRVRNAVLSIVLHDVEAYESLFRLITANIDANRRDLDGLFSTCSAWIPPLRQLQKILQRDERDMRIEYAVHRAIHAVLDEEQRRIDFPVQDAAFHVSSTSDIALSTSSAGLDVQIDASAPAIFA